MRLSRLTLAMVVSLRAVLVYGEAAGAASAEVGWSDLLPGRMRFPRPELGGQTQVRAVTGPSA
jgi:hypothetical protein